MKSRLVMYTALVIAAAALATVISQVSAMRAKPPVAHASLAPRLASYLGVFETGSPPSFEPLTEFGKAAGRQPNLVGYFSGWAQPFDGSYARSITEHGIIPFVQIDPTFAKVSAIDSGAYDSYLKAYAQSVRAFGHPVVIGFGHEMNAPWYPWGYGHLAPAAFVRTWRYIVTLFRTEGADNVTWLWTINADRPGTGPIADWWPGQQYVTWVGIDGYYFRPSDNFMSVFGRTINQVRHFTEKPILLSETAVGPQAGQFVKIGDLFRGMAKFKTLGLVWFDKAQHDGIFHQDWRIEDSQTAEYSFKLGVRDELAPAKTTR
jgi:mannan endo-1,4-beta-mannosidase